MEGNVAERANNVEIKSDLWANHAASYRHGNWYLLLSLLFNGI